MSEMETIYKNGWYIRSARGECRFIAWAKREMFQGSDPVDEAGEVFFGFGRTRVSAIDRLLRSLPSE